MERLCEHGVGHTVVDPTVPADSRYWGVHGCDGCCRGWSKAD